jgi:hypothetical protein
MTLNMKYFIYSEPWISPPPGEREAERSSCVQSDI